MQRRTGASKRSAELNQIAGVGKRAVVFSTPALTFPTEECSQSTFQRAKHSRRSEERMQFMAKKRKREL